MTDGILIVEVAGEPVQMCHPKIGVDLLAQSPGSVQDVLYVRASRVAEVEARLAEALRYTTDQLRLSDRDASDWVGSLHGERALARQQALHELFVRLSVPQPPAKDSSPSGAPTREDGGAERSEPRRSHDPDGAGDWINDGTQQTPLPQGKSPLDGSRRGDSGRLPTEPEASGVACRTCGRRDCEGTHMVDEGSYNKGVYDATHGKLPQPYNCGYPNCERCAAPPVTAEPASVAEAQVTKENTMNLIRAAQLQLESLADGFDSLGIRTTQTDQRQALFRSLAEAVKTGADHVEAQREQAERELAELREKFEVTLEMAQGFRAERDAAQAEVVEWKKKAARFSSCADALEEAAEGREIPCVISSRQGIYECRHDALCIGCRLRHRTATAQTEVASLQAALRTCTEKLTYAGRELGRAEGERLMAQGEVKRLTEEASCLIAALHEIAGTHGRETSSPRACAAMALEHRARYQEPPAKEPSGGEGPDLRLAEALANPPGPRHAKMVDEAAKSESGTADRARRPECPHGVGLCTSSCPSKQPQPPTQLDGGKGGDETAGQDENKSSGGASFRSDQDIEAGKPKTDCSVVGCGDLARTYGLCFAHARAAGRDAAHAEPRNQSVISDQELESWNDAATGVRSAGAGKPLTRAETISEPTRWLKSMDEHLRSVRPDEPGRDDAVDNTLYASRERLRGALDAQHRLNLAFVEQNNVLIRRNQSLDEQLAAANAKLAVALEVVEMAGSLAREVRLAGGDEMVAAHLEDYDAKRAELTKLETT